MKTIKKIMAIILTVLTILSATTVAYAAEQSQELKDYLTVTSEVSNGASKYSNEVQKIIDTGKNDAVKTNVLGDGQAISDETLKKLESLAKDWNEKQEIKDKVEQMGTDFSVKADVTGAAEMLSGVKPLVSLVVGLLSYIIVLGMPFFTALDIAYITMPVFRNKTEEAVQSGNGFMAKTNSSTGETKCRWITDEAMHAVQVCSLESGKNPLSMYLKNRIWAYILTSIVLYMLLSGNIQLIVNIATKFASGIINALAKLGE